jgi:Ca2+-dependent lipid-binding protein
MPNQSYINTPIIHHHTKHTNHTSYTPLKTLKTYQSYDQHTNHTTNTTSSVDQPTHFVQQQVINAQHLAAADTNGKSDPYCTIRYEGQPR